MIVRTEGELDAVFEALAEAKRYCVDTETVDYGFPEIALTGLSLGWSGEEGAYIPLGHAEGIQLPSEYVLGRLKTFAEENQDKLVVMHNAKYDLQVLELLGDVKFGPMLFDTMVASWLVDTEGEHGLKALVRRYLNYSMTELGEFAPKEKHPVTGDSVYRTDLVSIEQLGEYSIDDVTKPLQLLDVFLPRLEADGLLKVFSELEMPKVFMLKDVEMKGIRLDMEMLEQRFAEAPEVLAEIEERMYKLRPSGEPFNAGSTKQLNKILFEELDIEPIGEPGKTGLFSTNKENMEKWARDHELVGVILEYRQVSKLMGTYLSGLKKRVGKDGRIRTRFNPILTTGRLSSSKPNLQNIPRPDNDKFGLREMFIAADGCKLVVADYSQIELRVLAHISKDPLLVKAFVAGEDLHSVTAKVLFDLPEPVDEVKNKHERARYIAKTFNFAVVFEAGPRALAANAGVSEMKARELRDKFLRRYSGVKKYIDKQHALAERDGYVTTVTGRRRHLKDAQLKGRSQRENALKSLAERQAVNSSVQGSAADVLFIAMRNIRQRFKVEGLLEDVHLVLQVHDEIVYEVPEEKAEYVADLVREEMESAVKLRVPLVADVGIGDRWSECK